MDQNPILFEFQSGFHLNGLFWATSLQPEDRGAANRVIEDLATFFEKISLPFQVFEPRNSADFIEYLDHLVTLARCGARPILHIDMHGSKHNGLQIGTTGEYVPWKSVFEKFRAINIETQNNFCVVATVCFGTNILNGLDVRKATPFYMLIAPPHTISSAFIEDRIRKFYCEVFGGKSFIKPYKQHLAEAMELFHSEKALLTILARYVRDSCRGKGGDARREYLLTGLINRGFQNDRKSRRIYRKSIKTMIKPTQRLIDDCVSTFLMGRPVSFGIADVQQVANRISSTPERRD